MLCLGMGSLQRGQLTLFDSIDFVFGKSVYICVRVRDCECLRQVETNKERLESTGTDFPYIIASWIR